MKFRYKFTGEEFTAETYSTDSDTGAVWVQRLILDGRLILGGDAEIRVDVGCEPLDQEAKDMLANVQANVDADARHLRRQLAETGPLRSGEVAATLRDARALREQYARADAPVDHPVPDYTVLALPRYQAAALVFSALQTLGEYPADAPDYDWVARDHLMAALERLAPGLGNPDVLGLPRPIRRSTPEAPAPPAPDWVASVVAETSDGVVREIYTVQQLDGHGFRDICTAKQAAGLVCQESNQLDDGRIELVFRSDRRIRLVP